MRKTGIKICGVTQREDVFSLGRLGVDYIGFIFVEGSKRQLTGKTCEGLLEQMADTSRSVAVFMNQSLAFIQSILDVFPADIVQLHGEQDTDLVTQIDRPVIQRLHPAIWLQRFADKRPDNLLSYLVDPGAGQGETFDWQNYLREQPQTQLGDDWLAGGLDPNNIVQHINLLQPAVVDVCSGVEQDGRPGFKSLEKVTSFLQQAGSQAQVTQL